MRFVNTVRFGDAIQIPKADGTINAPTNQTVARRAYALNTTSMGFLATAGLWATIQIPKADSAIFVTTD